MGRYPGRGVPRQCSKMKRVLHAHLGSTTLHDLIVTIMSQTCFMILFVVGLILKISNSTKIDFNNQKADNNKTTTVTTDDDSSMNIYYYIIGGLLGLTIILLIILFISCWIKAKRNSGSDTTTTKDTTNNTTMNNITTNKNEKFSDWFAFGKKKNSPRTINDTTKESTFNPLTGEGGYSKYFDTKKK